MASLSSELLKLHSSLLRERKRVLFILQVNMSVIINSLRNCTADKEFANLCYVLIIRIFDSIAAEKNSKEAQLSILALSNSMQTLQPLFQDKDQIIETQRSELEFLRKKLTTAHITLSEDAQSATKPNLYYHEKALRHDSPKPPLPSRLLLTAIRPPLVPPKSLTSRLAVGQMDIVANSLSKESVAFPQDVAKPLSLVQHGGRMPADESADPLPREIFAARLITVASSSDSSRCEWRDRGDDSGRESDDTLDGSERSKADTSPAAEELSLFSRKITTAVESAGRERKTTVKFWTDAYL